MVFSSTDFLFLFFPITLLIYYNPLCKTRKFKNIFLFLVSIGFYAYGEPIFVFLMFFSIVVTWKIALKMDEKSVSKRKIWVTVGTIYHVGVFFIFKYFTFVSQQLGFLINKDIAVYITLPIGISFFTFQLMSYLFDVYYRDVEAQKNIIYLGLYISFFPQLIAGPIVRYKDIAHEIENRVENLDDFVNGMSRFIFGLGKKLLIANNLAAIADNIFTLSGSYNISLLTAWLGILAYTMQIYFDFSGYSDMAIGLGRMFGFHFLENFNYPYTSRSITEFWRRWHMSLSTWFRDYVYIPMGGSRVNKIKWIRNLFVVWALTGIWHGANWTFVVWGLFYFILLIMEKLTGIDKKLGFLSRIYTGLMVMIGWVLFRSDNIGEAFSYITKLFGIGADRVTDGIFRFYVRNGALIIPIAIILSFPVYPVLMKKLENCSPKTANIVDSVIVAIVFVLSILAVVSSTYNPFIYFNF